MTSILKDITKDNFEDYKNSIQRCINNLQSIFNTLNSYKLIQSSPQMQALKLIEGQLRGTASSIELEKSYKLFCELVGVKYEVKGENIEVVPVLLLAEAIKEHNVPILPWQSFEDNGFQIYDDNNEADYYKDLEGSKAKIVENPGDNISFKFSFDKNILSVLQEMKKHIRSREILHLYQYMNLMDDLGSAYKFEFGPGNLKNDHGFLLKTKELTNEIKKDYCKEKVKKLFKEHFLSTQKILKEKGTITTETNKIDERQWLELQSQLATFGKGLIQIEQQFKPTLIEIDNHIKNKNNEEKTNDKLYKEVNDFLMNNSLITYHNDEIRKFPTARQISNTKPGGPGILKRITDSGGLPQFKAQLQLYALRSKRFIPAVPTQSLDTSSYEGTLVKGTLKNNDDESSPTKSLDDKPE